MDIIVIAAVTADGYIAKNESDRLEWSQDLHLFKEQTTGYPLIMGSTTRALLQKELEGRKIIVVHRNDNPANLLENLNSDKCFIAGGGKTYSRFAPFATHLYLTVHPLIFGKGIPLFSLLETPMNLKLERTIPVPGKPALCQNQYRVLGHGTF